MHPDEPSDPPAAFFTLNGERLAFNDEGGGEHAVVAYPGLPGAKRDYRWLAPALSPSCRFVRIDPPGYGESTRSGYRAMTVAERAASVLALMDHLKLGPVTLLSHSSGAPVSTHIARHHPERVRACVLLAPAAPTPHYPVRLFRIVARILERRLGRVALKPVQRYFYGVAGFPKHLSDDELIYTTLDASGNAFYGYGKTLAALRVPVLIAWARDDRLIPARGFEALERLAPDGPRLRFESGGHNIQKTRATEIASAVAALHADLGAN